MVQGYVGGKMSNGLFILGQRNASFHFGSDEGVDAVSSAHHIK